MIDNYSSDGVICPHCKHMHDPSDDNYDLYDENTCEWECHSCANTFSVTVYVSYTWDTEVMDDPL